MNDIVFHIVSGHAFFTGIALLCVAALASIQTRPLFKRMSVLCFLLGVIAVVVSSTAIPYWYYAVASIITLAWIGSRFRTGWRRPAAYAVTAAWCGAAALEIPFHVIRSLEPATPRSLTVIGDSVTAGMGGEDTAETRVFLSVIAGRDSTLDSIHLSQAGHERMAECVWGLVESAFSSSP